MTAGRTILRFTRSERAYHWAQAVAYLTLMISGAVMLVRTVTHRQDGVQGLWEVVHKTAGVVILSLPFAVVLAGNWASLREKVVAAVCWNRDDLKWVKAAMVGLVRPGVEAPPTGLFNPGQKLNLLATLVLMPAMAATGLTMWFVKGALLAWLVHIGLFGLAVVLTLGHVYMAAVNPSTRHSLRGMVVGTVDLEWARRHHRRWVEDRVGGSEASGATPHRGATSGGPVILTAILLAAAVGGAAWVGIRFGGRVRLGLGQAMTLVDPGELTLAHESVERLRTDCYACHDLTRDVPDEKCLECHRAIGERMAGGRGFHGKLAGRCTGCHTDHCGRGFDIMAFDTRRFNHEGSLFRLRGAHRRLACGACHDRRKSWSDDPRASFIGLAYARCQDCHDDPHRGELGRRCSRCHTNEKWTGREVRFAHNRDSRFRLEGKHIEAACETCHRPPDGGALGAARFKGLATRCAGCHQDVHRGQFGADHCDRCHGVGGWAGPWLRFDHQRDSRFRLEGKHAEVQCRKCHPAPQGGPAAAAEFRTAPTACGGCHDDVHAGRFAADPCTKCHSVYGWKGRYVRFAHDRDTPFTLTGRHATIECGACHKAILREAARPAQTFASNGTKCADCHEDAHLGRLDRACRQCHDTVGWKRPHLLFRHDTQSSFRLDAAHAAVACEACHPAGRYKPVPTTCEGCHRDVEQMLWGDFPQRDEQSVADVHAGKVRCEECHDTGQRHQTVVSYARACVRCHNEHYAKLLLGWRSASAERILEAERLLEHDRGTEAARRDRTRRLGLLKRIGAHNFDLQTRRLKRLIESVQRPRSE